MHGYTRHRSSRRTSWLFSRVCSTPYLALSHLYCSTWPNRHWQRRMRSWRERERSGRMDWRLEASVPRWRWCSPSLHGILPCLPKCRRPMIRRLDLHLVTFYCNKRTTIYMVERVLGEEATLLHKQHLSPGWINWVLIRECPFLVHSELVLLGKILVGTEVGQHGWEVAVLEHLEVLHHVVDCIGMMAGKETSLTWPLVLLVRLQSDRALFALDGGAVNVAFRSEIKWMA